jgi:hypothetical protein
VDSAFGYLIFFRLRQAGYSESWLSAIFSNLPDELSIALQDAWIATMIAHRVSMHIALDSPHNQTRNAFAIAQGPGAGLDSHATVFTTIHSTTLYIKLPRHCISNFQAEHSSLASQDAVPSLHCFRHWTATFTFTVHKQTRKDYSQRIPTKTSVFDQTRWIMLFGNL